MLVEVGAGLARTAARMTGLAARSCLIGAGLEGEGPGGGGCGDGSELGSIERRRDGYRTIDVTTGLAKFRRWCLALPRGTDASDRTGIGACAPDMPTVKAAMMLSLRRV